MATKNNRIYIVVFLYSGNLLVWGTLKYKCGAALDSCQGVLRSGCLSLVSLFICDFIFCIPVGPSSASVIEELVMRRQGKNENRKNK